LELIIKIWQFEKKNLQNLANLGHFFYEKSFVLVENHIFQVKIWRKFASKRNIEFDIGPDQSCASMHGHPWY